MFIGIDVANTELAIAARRSGERSYSSSNRVRPPLVEAPELAEADRILTCALTGAIANGENELRAARTSEASRGHPLDVSGPLEYVRTS